MLLGHQVSVRCPASGEKLPDGVCFYLEGVPAGTTILGTCGKVTSTDSEWNIDFGDGTGVQTFSTTANIPEHTYSSEGDYVIQIIGSGITKISGVSASYYPVIATTEKADCPYVKKITVGSDFSFFPLGPYSIVASISISGRWAMFSQLDEIVLSKSVKTCALAGCLAYVFSYKPVVFAAPGLESIKGVMSLRYSYYVNPVSVLPKKQPSVDYSYFLAGAKITSLDGMPSGITGNLGAYCFQGCVNLTDVSGLPPGITGSANYAFSGCTSLKIANLPYIEKLCTSDFSGCTALTDIYIKGVGHKSSTASAYNFLTTAIAPNVTLHYVGDVPDYDCAYSTYLKHLDISNSSSVGYYAFRNCTGLLDVKVGNIDSNNNDPFSSCTALTTVTHNGGVTTGWFGGGTFQNLGITSIIIPDDMKVLRTTASDSVGNYGSFQGCTALATIDLKNIETLGQDTSNGIFNGCTGLTSVTAHKLKTIVGGQFSGCTSLSDIDAPMLETAGTYAFEGCTSIASFPSTCKNLGNGAFKGASSLHDETITIDSCGRFALSGTEIENVVLTASNIETTIAEVNYYGMFSGMRSLETISMPNLTDAGGYACRQMIRNSPNVHSISVPSLKRAYGSRTFSLMYYPPSTSGDIEYSNLSEFSVSSLESIGYKANGTTVDSHQTFEQAFAYCPLITELKFQSLTRVYNNRTSSASKSGYGAFYEVSNSHYQSSLKRLYFPKLSSLAGNCIPYLFEGNDVLEEIHFGVENKAYFTSHANWSTLFGLGSSWSGKIYFDLNEDGTTATNTDGSSIEPEYDGSQS